MDLLGGYDSTSASDPEDGGENDKGTDPTPTPTPANVNVNVNVARANVARVNANAKAKPQRADRRFLRAAPSISIMTRRKHGHELIVHRDSSSSSNATTATTTTTTTMITEPLQGPRAEDPSRSQSKATTTTTTVVDPSSFSEQRKKFQKTGQAIGPDATTTVVRTALGYNADRLRRFEHLEKERRKRHRELYGSDNNDDSDNDNDNDNDNDKEDEDASGTTAEGTKANNAAKKAKRNRRKQKRKPEPLVYGSDDEAVYGVWAPPSKEERWHADNALTDLQKGGPDALAPEQIAERAHIAERDRVLGQKEEENETQQLSGFERLMERKMAHLLPPRTPGDDRPMDPPKTTFHGDAETDYKGRSWMAPPPGTKPLGSDELSARERMEDHACYVPKKCVHRYTGHNQGVQRIRLFPNTGHLLLSAGLDGKCKIWSVGDIVGTTGKEAGGGNGNQRRVLRTYEGHKAAVRDVQFNHDGSRFVSASFDRFLRLWDTESGAVINTFGNQKVPYCVEFYPRDDNYFVVGTSDNKIVAYDCTTAEITQEYNHHLAPVNAIAFVEEDNGNVKMVSSSDDKKVLVWEWDIGVPIKYISDPTMHSMPSLAMHPSHQYLVGQSLDNQIVCFQVGQKFKLSKTKKFGGHQVAGYACEPAFSPDGRFLMSGDGKGRLFVWDWKRQKVLQKFRAHDQGPTIACVWHPLYPSVAFTCGWDGVIKMWQ